MKFSVAPLGLFSSPGDRELRSQTAVPGSNGAPAMTGRLVIF